ncbi:hypothetical protein B0I75DRAFT_146879 [Yarrowia lipolytica]|nr:hypothetical protein B0I74DRAFT_159259 [Yarrowia lipolytica]RDW51823.1 hypothetical protein B0I75DRAFT_146879 [Yarrowia lipolytica]
MCSIDLAGSIVRFYDPPIGYISSNVSGDYSGSSSHRSYSSPSSSSSNRVSKSSSSRSSYSSSSRLTVYIDGACSNNQSSNARASVGVYFSAGKSDDVHSRNDSKSYDIKTGLQYTVNSLNNWGDKWQSNGSVTSNNEPVKTQRHHH